jgi:protein-tyrosine phosphatase
MLEGQINFRDLGGIRTRGGSVVASGQVYRSGELSALTDGDLALLDRLRIRTVVDLRSETEAARQPDRLPDAVEFVAMPILPGGNGSGVDRFLQTFDPADFPPWERIYRDLIRDHVPVLTSLVRLIADPAARPLVFHCATGKDRTGIVAALLLSALDVEWSDVEADYLESNAILQPERGRIMEQWLGSLRQRGVHLDAAAVARIEQLLLAEPDHLAAARDEMIRCCGSVDGYIEDALGIDGDTRDSLRRQLLG